MATTTATTTATPTTVALMPDLVLQKQAFATNVVPGMLISYTLTYSNVGSATAMGVTITETVPANTTFVAAESSVGWHCTTGAANDTCTYEIAEVDVNQSGEIIFTIMVDMAIQPGSQIVNTAQIGTRFDQREAILNNNVDQLRIIVSPPTALESMPEPQQPLTITIYLPYIWKIAE